MKKFLSLFCFGFFALALFSCTNNPAGDDPIPDLEKPITNGGGILKFAIEADAPWKITREANSESFIKVTPSSGSVGLSEIIIEVSPHSQSYAEKIDFGGDMWCVIANNWLGSGAYYIAIHNSSKHVYVNGFQTTNSMVGCAALQLYLYKDVKTPINSIDVSRCSKLGVLAIGYDKLLPSKLTTIDVSNTYVTRESTSLVGLQSYKALLCKELENLDFTKSTELKSLAFSGTKIKTIDLSKNTQLETLEITNNTQLTEVFLKTGQTVKNLKKDPQTVIKYK